MMLHIAVRELVEKWGEDIIIDLRFKKLLTNKRAYKEIPELKSIMEFAIDLGYINKVFESCQNEDWEEEVYNHEMVFNERSGPMGFSEELVQYVFGCIPYALGLLEFENSDDYEDEEEGDDYEDDEDGYEDEGEGDDYEDEEEDVENDLYSITKQYHEKKDISIYVVRTKNRLNDDDFENSRKLARQYGKGYYSSYRGVNGFVFYSLDDAKAFANELSQKNINMSIPQNEEINSPSQNTSSFNYNAIKNLPLYIAMRRIIEERGVEIINNYRFISFLRLSDIQLIDPEEIEILWNMYKVGVLNELYSAFSESSGEWTNKWLQIEYQYVKKHKEANVSIVHYIFDSIAYGLKLKNDQVEYNEKYVPVLGENKSKKEEARKDDAVIIEAPASIIPLSSDPMQSVQSRYESLKKLDLHVALRNIIDIEGVDIINESRIINILSDCKTFDAMPASKYILRAIIADGYTKRLLSFGKWDVNAMTLCNHFATCTGFQEEYVNLIFQSLAYGLGYLNSITPFNTTNNPPKQPNAISNPNLNASIFQLTYRELNRKSEKFVEKYKEDAEAYLDSIIEMSGDWSTLGAEITPSSEYTIYSNDHQLFFLFEIKGPITYRPYSGYLTFNVILQNDKGRVIGKTLGLLDKKSFKVPYQVKKTDSFSSNNIRTIGSIAKIIVYWEE